VDLIKVEKQVEETDEQNDKWRYLPPPVMEVMTNIFTAKLKLSGNAFRQVAYRVR